MSRRFRKIPRAPRSTAGEPVADLRQAPGNAEVASEPAEVDEADEVSYRDLQVQAKAAGLNASGTRDELERRIAEAKL